MYYTFFGIKPDDWQIQWSGAIDHQYLLVKDYLSEACSFTTSTVWSTTGTKFIYPHNIKKRYYVEGVVEGHFTLTATSAQSWVSNYIVDILKIDEYSDETIIASTGSITVDDSIDYDAGYHIGDDVVYPFWIDVFASPTPIGENERLAVKIRWDVEEESSTSGELMHDNDSTYEDFKIKIPFLLGD